MALKVLATCRSSWGPASAMGGACGSTPNCRAAAANCFIGATNWRAATALTNAIDNAKHTIRITHRPPSGTPQNRIGTVLLTKESGQQGKDILVIIDEREVWH